MLDQTLPKSEEQSDRAKESARIKICEAIGRAKKPTSNFTADERRAFRELHASCSVERNFSKFSGKNLKEL